MKRFLISVLCIFTLSFFSGCDTTYLVEEEVEPTEVLEPNMMSDVGIIELLNDPPSESGIIKEIYTESGRSLQITSDTLIMAMRGSDSGFSVGNINDFSISSTVRYYFYMTDVNFTVDPDIYPVEKIYVYSSTYSNIPVPSE